MAAKNPADAVITRAAIDRSQHAAMRAVTIAVRELVSRELAPLHAELVNALARLSELERKLATLERQR